MSESARTSGVSSVSIEIALQSRIEELESELAAIKLDKDFWEKALEAGAKNSKHDYIMRLSAEVSENKKLREVIRTQHEALKNLQNRVSNDADAHAWWQDEQVAAIYALAKASELGVSDD